MELILKSDRRYGEAFTSILVKRYEMKDVRWDLKDWVVFELSEWTSAQALDRLFCFGDADAESQKKNATKKKKCEKWLDRKSLKNY